MKHLPILLSAAVLVFSVTKPTYAFEPPRPQPNYLSYRVFEGVVEGIPPKILQLTIVGRKVTGKIMSENSKRSSEIVGTRNAGKLELIQLSGMAWDHFDKEHFEFLGEANGFYESKPLTWTGTCRSLLDGTNFVGTFKFREVYRDGVAKIDLIQIEKRWSQIRNTIAVERGMGGIVPQIREPSAGGKKVNELIRKQWYQRLFGKEPKNVPTITELEEAITFIPPDPEDDRGFGNINQSIHIITPTVVSNGHELVSILWHEYNFLGSESWPESNQFRTYDLISGKQITLDELLKPGYEGPLAEAIEKAYREIYVAPDESKQLTDGFGEMIFKDRSDFFIMIDGGIGFDCEFMDQPKNGIAGLATVRVSRDLIAPMMKSGSVLDRIKPQ